MSAKDQFINYRYALSGARARENFLLRSNER